MKQGDTVHIFLRFEEAYEEWHKGFVEFYGTNPAWIIQNSKVPKFILVPPDMGPLFNTTRMVLIEKNIYRKEIKLT